MKMKKKEIVEALALAADALTEVRGHENTVITGFSVTDVVRLAGSIMVANEARKHREAFVKMCDEDKL